MDKGAKMEDALAVGTVKEQQVTPVICFLKVFQFIIFLKRIIYTAF